MEDSSRLKLNLRDQQLLGNSETVATQARQSLTLHDRLKPEKPTSLYADLHHQYTKNIRDISPKRSGDFLKQRRKATQEEELVKYMSHLPSYLERGEYRQEKVLNVGVLDWGRLEKWQCSQKQILQRSSRHSLSSANSSSSLSTEGSSLNSSSGQSCSSSDQRSHRPSLKFHLMSSPAEIRSRDVNSLEESIQKFQNVKGSQANTTNEQEMLVRREKLFSKNFAEIKLDSCNRRDFNSKINPESGTFNGANFEAMQKMKVKTNTRDDECMKTVKKLQGQKAYATADVSQTTKRVVLHPRDLSQGDRLLLSESRTMLDHKGAEASRRSFSEMPESSPGVVSSDVPHSCPLICENDGCTEVKWGFSDAESISFLPDSSRSLPHSTKRGISPSRSRMSEIKKSSITPIISTSKKPSTGLELNPSKAAAEKPRSTSPFRRLSIGMGKISKSFNSKEDSSLPHLNTTPTAKSTSHNATAHSFQSTSSDMQNATSRARSSPLRWLLDPLLKPKAPNCHESAETLQRDSVSTDRFCKSSRGQVDSSTGARQPGIVKLDMANCREINIDDSAQEKKHGTSTFQAFLQVAVKNGQPVFTFAAGNERNVLAATMKKLSSSREDDYSCIYTFFAFKEVRKKNGRWINQGGKGKSHDYIPNVVAQLKVSSSQFSQSFVREFVLFSVDLRQAEHQTLDLQANDELAAIVVKIPKVINKSTDRDLHLSSECNDFPELRFDSTSAGLCMINGQSLISTTVILPSGVHSLPNKGGPSSLIQRWRSGGSCDCGGWDLGCKLRTFANDNQYIKKSCPSKAISDKFELVSQGGEEENRHVFSLAPFKDGIYSVEFTSSLSILQAFSLCVAVLDSKKLCETLESSNLMEGKISLETILAQNDGTRVASNGIDGEVPARYVSNPPHSPVGRV